MATVETIGGGLPVTEVRFSSASRAEQRSGLLGYITVVLADELRLDGLTFRRTQDGRLSVSYPERRDTQGRSRCIVRPISNWARLSLEQQILARLPGAIEESER